VLVPPFLATSEAVALTGRLPRLELVQLLTAEWIVAVLLAVYRHLPDFVRAQAEPRWAYHQTEELAGKRVLVVGAGDVAEHTVRRLAPFEVETTLVGRRARDGVHGIDEVRDLLPRHDACVVIVPLTNDTRGLIDAAFLAAMPDGALLVNAARGPVADTDALTAELTSGRLRAAVDVTDPEPLPAEHPLWRAPGLLLTPHVGGSVPGAMPRAYRIAAEQVAAYSRGERPPNLVENGY
jgi:phosphoglycerate dehydrogenase-like enzyme